MDVANPNKRTEEQFVVSEDNWLITLVSKDSITFRTTLEIAKGCTLFSDMMDEQEDDGINQIPCPNIKGQELERVIMYCDYHYNHPGKEIKPKFKDLKSVILPWDWDYVSHLTKRDVVLLIKGADYLYCQKLINLCAAYLLQLARLCNTADEIRDLFGIEKDFTNEEEDAILKECAWIDDKEENSTRSPIVSQLIQYPV